MRFTATQYAQAISVLHEGSGQLAPDTYSCRICHDTDHQAWECGHNPLLAMATCEGIAKAAEDLHERLHAIEEAPSDGDRLIAEWRDDVHAFLHHLAGHDTVMGHQVGPASILLPTAETTP